MFKKSNYSRFIKHMNNSVIGLPDNEALMPLLGMILSAKEVKAWTP